MKNRGRGEVTYTEDADGNVRVEGDGCPVCCYWGKYGHEGPDVGKHHSACPMIGEQIGKEVNAEDYSRFFNGGHPVPTPEEFHKASLSLKGWPVPAEVKD